MGSATVRRISGGFPMRVLVVEDDVVTAAKIQIVLGLQKFICDIAHVGESGIKLAKSSDYDIIILDLILPDIDGYEVLGDLRAAGVKTPILILSGLSEVDDKI